MASEIEWTHAWQRIEDAMLQRKPIEVSFFKERKDAFGNPVLFKDGSPMYVRVTRVVEPFDLQFSLANNPYVTVVDRSPNDAERPATRRIRLDRIAVWCSKGKRRMRLRVRASDRYLCPSPLDELATV